jgi:prepilin-type N-terminal cleavage/methylation domain-containing protein
MWISRRHRAFTLIELLVVIVIIAVLAAILFPVFAQAKAASKKATAMSNLGQVGKSVVLYASDADDHLPFRYPFAPKWQGFNRIPIVLGSRDSLVYRYEPYLKSKDVWFSPDDRLSHKGVTSFAFNAQLCYSWSLTEVERPAETVYMTDRTDVPSAEPSQDPLDYYVWWFFLEDDLFESPNQLPGTLVPANVLAQISPNRYTGKVSLYQFLDSHVRAQSFESTWGDQATNLHLVNKK